MTDERVSDERLAEFVEQLRSSAEDWKQIDEAFSQIDPSNNGDDGVQYYQDRISLLLELQARRQSEREAMAGAEEMARSLCNTFVRVKHDNLHHSNPGIVRRLQEEEITAALAPLYAKLSDLEKDMAAAEEQLDDIRDEIYNANVERGERD